MKKVFFALFAVATAIGGSAFTSAKVTGTVYGNTDGNYAKSTTTIYDNTNCDSRPLQKTCAYQVTAAGQAIVTASSYSDLQMSSFLASEYVEIIPGASNGLYVFD